METPAVLRGLMALTPAFGYGAWRLMGYTLAHTALTMCWVCMWVMALGALGFETFSPEGAAWALLSVCALAATNSRHAPKRDGSGRELVDWALLMPFVPLLAWHHASFGRGDGAALWLIPEICAATWWCLGAACLIAGAMHRANRPTPPVAPPKPEEQQWRPGRRVQ